MGYGLSKISPITFDGDAFQMPSNRAQDEAPMLTPRRRRNEVNTESIPPAQAPQQDGNAKPYNAELSVACNGSNKPSSRFVPPQPNNTGSSSQEMDNSNTTTVYHEKSTGKHQNKSTSIQTSPRHPESRGTATATQTTNKKASQVGGTQTTPPTSPRSLYQQEEHKHPLQETRVNQTAIRKVSQPIIHQVKSRRPRSQLLMLHLILDHLQDHQSDLEMTSHPEI